jgi:hypothetical protein
MAAARDEGFSWSRFLLVLISVGFLGVAALALVGDLFAVDPQDRVPDVAILAPGGIAVCGLALAAIGGRVASAVSGVLGAVFAAAAVWGLAQAGPSGWFDSHFSVVAFSVLIGAGTVGVAAVVLAVRDLCSARTIPPVTHDGRPGRTRLLGLFTHVLSWLIVAGLVATVAGTGWWYYQTTYLTPGCGHIADTQLRGAIQDMKRRIPGLRFTDVESGCDSASDAYAEWEHDDAKQLVADARAAGCLVNDRALFNEGAEAFVTCPTSSRTVVFTIDIIDVVPLAGSMTMT